MSEIKLLPCPFCGGENLKMGSTGCSMGTDVYIKCTCGAKIQMREEYGSEKLIEAWNTRNPMDDIVEKLSKLAEDTPQYDLPHLKIPFHKAIDIIRNGGKE